MTYGNNVLRALMVSFFPDSEAQQEDSREHAHESLAPYYCMGIGFVCFCIGALCAQQHKKRKKNKRREDEAVPRSVHHVGSVVQETPMLEIFVLDTPVGESHPLERILCDDGGSRFVAALCADLDAHLHPHIAHEMVLLMYSLGTTPHILEGVIEIEAARINASSHAITLNTSTYPCNSAFFSPLLWKLLRKYALLIGRPFLKAALAGVTAMVEALVASEEIVSPEHIQHIIAAVVNNLLGEDCAIAMPKQVRRICRTLHTSVSRKFPGNPAMSSGSVGRFLLSGLLASGLLAPQEYGLYNNKPGPGFLRIMLQVAQAIHHMGQGTLFGNTNVILKSINQQILMLTPRVQKFLEAMTKIDIQAQSDSPSSDLSEALITPEARQHAINTLAAVVVKTIPRMQKLYAEEKFMEYLATLRGDVANHTTDLVRIVDNAADIAYAEFEGELTAATVASEETLARSLEELPAAVQRIVMGSGIPHETLNTHFDVVLNILHFKKLYPPRHLRHPLMVLSSTSKFDYQAAEQLIVPGHPKRLYKDLTRIGKGGFGSVYVARNGQGKRVAIKRLVHQTSKEKRRNLAEVRYLSTFKHDNIVNYQCCHSSDNELWIVMEYMAGGTLTQAATNYRFAEEQISYIARELLKALSFIHSKGLVHRDVKSDNCMLSTKGEVKLIDFGLCLDVDVEGTRNHLVGSPFWMSPEMIVRRPHSYPTDIWSFAVCLLELANRHAPNKDSYIRAMFTVATKGLTSPLEQPDTWSPLFHDFLSKCLHQDPEQRYTAAQLLQHSFIKKAASAQAMESLLSQVFVQNLLEQTGI